MQRQDVQPPTRPSSLLSLHRLSPSSTRHAKLCAHPTAQAIRHPNVSSCWHSTLCSATAHRPQRAIGKPSPPVVAAACLRSQSSTTQFLSTFRPLRFIELMEAGNRRHLRNHKSRALSVTNSNRFVSASPTAVRSLCSATRKRKKNSCTSTLPKTKRGWQNCCVNMKLHKQFKSLCELFCAAAVH
jgi:hypothetical protein